MSDTLGVGNEVVTGRRETLVGFLIQRMRFIRSSDLGQTMDYSVVFRVGSHRGCYRSR